jgi:hypothetical protein
MREVALLPGSDPCIFEFPRWLPIVQAQHSHELWIDVNRYMDSPDITEKSVVLEEYLQQHTVKQLVFYDMFHANPGICPKIISTIKHYQSLLPTTYITTCREPIPELQHVCQFDFYWNRTKSAYLDKRPTWKQSSPGNFNQWPVKTMPRPFAVLSLHGANNWHAKKHLYNSVQAISGHHSNPTISKVFPSDSGEGRIEHLAATPPARHFFDDTYVTVQLESMWTGPNVVLTEKTYDHLIHGRILMNFGPRHYYRNLVESGWRLPRGIDYSWDEIPDSLTPEETLEFVDLSQSPRFNAYIQSLFKLTADIDLLHELFVSNLDVFEHNQQQLQQKPYDIFDINQLDR